MYQRQKHIGVSSISPSGDADFNALYQEHWEDLYHYVYGIVKDEEDTADILQEAFFSFWRIWEKKSIIHSPKDYLFIITRHTTLRFIASKKRRQYFLNDLANFLTEEFTASTEAHYDGVELGQLIDEQVKLLPAKMRSVFLLSRQESLSHKEIAKQLGISEKTVRKQVQNALRVLRSKLNSLSITLFFVFIVL